MTKKKDSNQEDKKTWEDYIRNPSDVFDKDQDISSEIQKKNDISSIYMDLLWTKQTIKQKKL